MQEWNWLLALALCEVALPHQASAAACYPTPGVLDMDFDVRKYRISTTNLGLLEYKNGDRISEDVLISAIIKSADTWNEQTNGKPFVYDGPTTELDPDCNEDWSLVVVNPLADDALARTGGVCYSNEGAKHFIIYLYVQDLDLEEINWWTHGTNIGSDEYDVISVMTHEFGHTLGIGHHPSWVYGTMTMITPPGTLRKRNLYRGDMRCAVDMSGHRDTSAFTRLHQAGSFASEENVFGSWPISHVSMGVTWWSEAGGTKRSAAAKHKVCPFWTKGLDRYESICLWSSTSEEKPYIAKLTEATFQENTAEDRVFYSSYHDYPAGAPLEEKGHRVKYNRSSNGFRYQLTGNMYACRDMTGWMECGFIDEVRSGKAVSVAWDDYTRRSVFVWVHQTRRNLFGKDGAVRVAVGQVSVNRLPEPETVMDVHSNVTPGIACKKFQVYGNYDCMLAVVPQDDPLMRIRVYRFWAATRYNRYELQISPSFFQFTLAATGSRIAAWYHNGQFYLAYRSMDPGQKFKVFSSDDTDGWHREPGVVSDYSNTGPSAASYWTGDNQLAYTK